MASEVAALVVALEALAQGREGGSPYDPDSPEVLAQVASALALLGGAGLALDPRGWALLEARDHLGAAELRALIASLQRLGWR